MTLDNSFFTHFECLSQFGDLEDTILRQMEAVNLTPDSHPHKPSCLNNLGISFLIHLLHLSQLNNLEDAISRADDMLANITHPFMDDLEACEDIVFPASGDKETEVRRKGLFNLLGYGALNLPATGLIPAFAKSIDDDD